MSSASNLAITLAVAHYADPRLLGVFGTALAIYSAVLAVGRASLSYVVISTGAQDIDEAAVAAIYLGVLGAIAAVILGIVGGSAVPLLLVGLAMPIIALQDFQRIISIAKGRPERALVSDAIWLSVFVLVGLTLSSNGMLNLTTSVLAWTGAATLALVPFRLPAMVLSRSVRWIRTNVHIAGSYMIDTLIQWGGFNLGTLLLAAVGGFAALGHLRATIILFSPLNLLNALLPPLVLPRVKRWDRDAKLWRNLLLLSASLAAVNGVMALCLAAHVVPNSVGARVLGRSWTISRLYLYPVAAYNMASVFNVSCVVAMRARMATSAVVRARTGAAGIELLCGVVGLWIARANGLLYGLAFGQTVALFYWWRCVPARAKETDSV